MLKVVVNVQRKNDLNNKGACALAYHKGYACGYKIGWRDCRNKTLKELEGGGKRGKGKKDRRS